MKISTVTFIAICASTLGLVQASYAVPPTSTTSTSTTSTCSSSTNTWCVGSDGWTIFRGSSGTGTCGNASSNYTGTCVVYVANSGNDATCSAQPLPVTSNPAHPCATSAKAQSLLRNGSPDWMLLRKGDTWSGGINGPTSGQVAKSGRSAAEPMLISSYGTGARPLFKTNGVDVACIASSATRGQYLAIVGIECYTDNADPASSSYMGVTAKADTNATSPTLTNMVSTSGIAVGYVAYGSGINGLTVQSVTANSVTLSGNPDFTSTQRSIQFNRSFSGNSFSLIGVTNFLIIEDCKLNFGNMTIVNNAAAPVVGLDLRIRRNIVVDSWGFRGSNGVFLSDNQLKSGKILFEENLVDHAGYNTSVWGGAGSVFSHSFYLHGNNPPISFIRNITANSSATGAQVRNGGTIYNNLSIGNPIAFVSNPGIQFNETTTSYNVITEGSDIIVGLRNASGITSSGSKVLNLDGVLTSGSYGFVTKQVANLDNPGSVNGYVVSVTATTATMSVNVAAGKRGDGVKPGDRLAIYMPRAQGIVAGPTGTFAPDANTGGGTYPVGSTAFYFEKGCELPTWVVPGMSLGVYLKNTAFPGGGTTIASISADRLSLHTATASTLLITGGSTSAGTYQDTFAIWGPSAESYVPKQTVGPNNIFTTSAALSNASFAFSQQQLTRNLNSAGNYYYNWNSNTSLNLEDNGVPGANINLPNKLNVAGSTSYPNATIEAYDTSIGGPGTAAHFLSQARLQSKDRWDIRYTANAANNFIRNAIGCDCAQ